MKTYFFRNRYFLMTTVMALFCTSCVKDLLNQVPTGELDSGEFWKTEADALIALNGAYNEARKAFGRDYYWDGQGEFQRTGNVSFTDPGNTTSFRYAEPTGFRPANSGSQFDRYYMLLYGLVNRANYVIGNIATN